MAKKKVEEKSYFTGENEGLDSLFGAEPSPADIRDYIAESIYRVGAEELPKKVDHSDMLPPIKNQGSLGTCVAQVGATMKEWQERKEDNLLEPFSPMFIYNNRSNQGSSGMFGSNLMSILHTMGDCIESDYPYGNIEAPEKISEEVRKFASNFKVKEYAKILSVEGMKKAVAINGPCYIAVPVYDKPGPNGMWDPAPDAKIRGGHAMTIVGYDDDDQHFKIRNSWGEGWGNGGYCWFPYSDWGKHWDAWTNIDEESRKEDRYRYDDDPIPKKFWDNFINWAKDFYKVYKNAIFWFLGSGAVMIVLSILERLGIL